MIGIQLEFAANTAEANQKLIKGAFDPKALVLAYKQACAEHRTHDIVVLCPDLTSPHTLFSCPRKDIRARFNKLPIDMFGASAHTIVQAPVDVDAFWVCVLVPGSARPASAVVFTIPYEQELVGAPN